LTEEEEYINAGKYKVLMLVGNYKGIEFTYHHNILVNHNTTFVEYYDAVKDNISKLYAEGYEVHNVSSFMMRVWNMDSIHNKKIKITRLATGARVSDLSILKKPTVTKGRRHYSTNVTSENKKKVKPICITPIPEHLHMGNLDAKTNFAAIDIETVKAKNGAQSAIAISLVYIDKVGKHPSLIKKLFISDEENKLFKQFIDFINSDEFLKNDIKIIFAHNLGDFDGLFLLRGIIRSVADINEIQSLIDQHNKFILIKYKNITFKDSMRIFNVSLNDLCKNFGGLYSQGKISEYKKEFNSLDMFDNLELFSLFKEYSLNDSVCFSRTAKALATAQEHYIKNYQVDITSIYSTSTLSLKIFRQHHLKDPIPILKRSEDAFIRESYFGGATDYYIKYAESLYYSDVNSLYPFAMKNPMPVNIKERHYFFREGGAVQRASNWIIFLGS
jgi:hypothetical protein